MSLTSRTRCLSATILPPASYQKGSKRGVLASSRTRESFYLYDPNIRKFVRKTVYSYGFFTNEVGVAKGDKFIFDSVNINAEPDYWKGLRIRNVIQRHSNDEFSTGLQTAKKGEGFRLYGSNRFRRTK